MEEEWKEIEKYLKTPNIGFNPSIPDIYVGIVFDKFSIK